MSRQGLEQQPKKDITEIYNKEKKEPTPPRMTGLSSCNGAGLGESRLKGKQGKDKRSLCMHILGKHFLCSGWSEEVFSEATTSLVI